MLTAAAPGFGRGLGRPSETLGDYHPVNGIFAAHAQLCVIDMTNLGNDLAKFYG